LLKVLSYAKSLLFLSTYFIICDLILFVLRNYFKIIEIPFPFVKILVRLISPVIYFISAISLYLYNCRKHNILIIRRFFCVILSLTRQSYSDFESVQNISSKLILRILSIVALIVPVISKPSTIIYNLETSMLLVIFLYLIEV
jgi:hypothetical protein